MNDFPDFTDSDVGSDLFAREEARNPWEEEYAQWSDSEIPPNRAVCNIVDNPQKGENQDYGCKTVEQINIDDDDSSDNLIIDEPTQPSQRGKRQLSVEALDKLVDIDEDCTVIVEPPTKKHKNERLNRSFSYHHDPGVISPTYPEWNFLTFNDGQGQKFYVKFNEVENGENIIEKYTSISNKMNLLGEPFENVKKRVRNCDYLDRNKRTSDGKPNTEETLDLWVEKYKPKKYIDLLSDEGVNRSLLIWLKKWDKIVFNKTLPRARDMPKQKKTIHKTNAPDRENYDGFDEEGRPFYKIALLCGPPGLGKTTLAHVVATHAGYNVIEVNASDDRSVEAFHEKLEAATKMCCVIGPQKPNCLILDEIDGAPSSSIDYLLKYINGKASQKGRKDKRKGVTKRPIICICNEPYVPALRQLRQQAYVVHFPNTSSTRLSQRLLEICRKQKIKSDITTLTLLCNKMQSDIRSCISTLYFYKNQNGSSFKPSDVSDCLVAQKDDHKDLFSLWQEVFQVPMRKGLSNSSKSYDDYGNGITTNFHYSPEKLDRLRFLAQLFHSYGDYDRLQQGVYENFLNFNCFRNSKSYSHAMDWFCWSDILDTNIRENQNYILLQYLPYAFAAWHFLFSSYGFKKITFPKAGYENYLKACRNKQILNDILRGLSPSIRSRTQTLTLVLDILPMFKSILVPPLRPVNTNLFNEKEKKDFDHLIDVMLDYNLTYILHRTPEGMYHYEFDPNIEEITQFSEMERRKLPYNMKLFISRELELEKVRRADLQSGSETENKNSEETNENESALLSKVPNHLQKLTPRQVTTKSGEGAQYRDFFGRIVKARPARECKGVKDVDEKYKSKLWVTFMEGFNNAVKKEITIEDLF